MIEVRFLLLMWKEIAEIPHERSKRRNHSVIPPLRSGWYITEYAIYCHIKGCGALSIKVTMDFYDMRKAYHFYFLGGF